MALKVSFCHVLARPNIEVPVDPTVCKAGWYDIDVCLASALEVRSRGPEEDGWVHRKMEMTCPLIIYVFCRHSILAELWDIRPSRMRILRLVLMLFVSMHLFACIYWRVKVALFLLLNTSLHQIVLH